MISKIVRMVEDAQSREAPVQRLADSIAGPFVYSVMTLSAATFAFWYFVGSHIFPDVLLNDIAGPEGDPLLLSLKLSVDVLVRMKHPLFTGFQLLLLVRTCLTKPCMCFFSDESSKLQTAFDLDSSH